MAAAMSSYDAQAKVHDGYARVDGQAYCQTRRREAHRDITAEFASEGAVSRCGCEFSVPRSTIDGIRAWPPDGRQCNPDAWL